MPRAIAVCWPKGARKVNQESVITISIKETKKPPQREYLFNVRVDGEVIAANQTISSLDAKRISEFSREYLSLFEAFSKQHDPVLVATMLVSILKDLRRKGVKVENITDNHMEGVLQAVKLNKTAKESIPGLLEMLAAKPRLTAGEAILELGAGTLTEQQLREIVKQVFNKWPQLVTEKKQGALMGEVMKEVRGKCDGGMVAKVLREMLGG